MDKGGDLPFCVVAPDPWGHRHKYHCPVHIPEMRLGPLPKHPQRCRKHSGQLGPTRVARRLGLGESHNNTQHLCLLLKQGGFGPCKM